MALLDVTPITQDGVDQDAAAVAADVAGDSVKASSGLFIHVINGDGSPHTATVAKPKSATLCPPFGELDIDDIIITIPAGESRSFTIPQGFADASGNYVWTYDAITSVTTAVFSLA